MGGRFRSVADRLLQADADLGRFVAGVDEAGRGPLAGCITGAVVAYRPEEVLLHLEALYEVRDSKTLPPARRESAAAAIREHAVGFSIFEYTAAEIDEHGIQACNRGLVDAALDWAEQHGCDVLVVDGTIRPSRKSDLVRVEVRPKADGTSLAVASASILAKTHRDAAMKQADYLYPGYGFAQHSGYGSEEHIAAIIELGLTELHRRSFCRRILAGEHG